MRRLLGGLLLLLVWSGSAQASSAVTISPAAHEVVLDAMTSEAAVSIKITNQTAGDLAVNLKTADFGPLDATGGIAFLGDDDQSWQHRLAPWLTLDRDRLTLAAGQAATVTVHIHNRADLAPGGHYAALLASIQDSVDTIRARSGASLQGMMSAQFFVVKKGGERYNLELLDLWPSGVVWWWPTTGRMRLRAGGNTHVKPYGTITVTGWRQVVAKGIINEDSALILPGSTRILETDLRKLGPVWPGRYHLAASIHDQANERVITESRTLWYIPAWLPIVLILIVIASWRRRRV